jgi:hypothetical protein
MASTIPLLQNQAQNISTSLRNSPTAFAPDTAPTKSDLSRASQLASVNKQIDTIRSTALRNQWYGASTPTNTNDVPAEGAGTSDGWLMGGLKAIQKPLNAIAGTAQYVLGKGTESSLTGNINQAMKTGVTFGNVLQQEGLPRAAQIPLGFALDVMFDPVNWLTAGTAALIPRIGTGLVKGGLKEGGIMGAIDAAKTGLVSNVAKKSITALNMVPFAKNIPKYSGLVEKVGKSAIENADKYDTLIGSTVYDRLGKGIFGQPSGMIGNTAENLIRKVPSVDIMGKSTPSGDQIADFFKYSTKNAGDVADLKDKVSNLAKDKGAILVRSEKGADFQSIDEFLKPNATITIKNAVGGSVDSTIRTADGIILPEFTGQVKVYDSIENAKSLLESAGEDYNLKHLSEAYKITKPGETGVQWYDDVVNRIKSTTVDDVLHARLGPGDATEAVQAEADNLVKTWNSYDTYRDLKPFSKILDAQKSLLSVFKSAKVPMNVSSHVVAHIGNFFMGAMMGLPVSNSAYVDAVIQGSKLVKGRLGAQGLRDIFFNDFNSWVDFIDKNPNRFRQLTGMDPKEIVGKISAEQKVMGVLGTNMNEVKKFLTEAWDNVAKGIPQANQLSEAEGLVSQAGKAAAFESAAKPLEKAAMKKGIGEYKTASETLAEMTKEAPIRQSEMPGTWSVSETPATQTIQKFKNYVAEQAAASPNNIIKRLTNTVVNSMPRWYEHIDQSFKIGTTDYLSRVGLTESQLVAISRTVPITKTDLLEPAIVAGQKMYRLTPLKSAEVATEAFMNYAAMPDFVKVMRALPIVGSPFLSFAYAMAVKTGKTAVNNPAIFNKVGFMLNEISGSRSPEEKAAMEQKYNQYLKSPTVVKVFGMWNTDVKNWVPWFQMNMLNPSEKTYDNSTQSQILKLMDNVPVFQDPVGSVLKNYFIQPWVLSGSGQIPQGQFGEPLYPSFDENGKPINASLGTKAFYGARSVAESLVPGVAGYAGWPAGLAGITPGETNLVPSYGFRNLANATQGRSSIGATTKEDAVRKTIRSLLGRTGIPAYTLDTTKTSLTKP